MVDKRRTRAHPSPGGFKSLDDVQPPRKPRKTKLKQSTSTDDAANASADHEQEAAPSREQRAPSPTPTASNSFVSAESRSVSMTSDVDDSRSSASPPPPEKKRIQTRSKTRSLSPPLSPAATQATASSPRRRTGSKKRPRTEDLSMDGENNNADGAHEQHPAKRNKTEESSIRHDTVNTALAVEQQATVAEASYTHQGDDAQTLNQSDEQHSGSTLASNTQSTDITASNQNGQDQPKPSARKGITWRQVPTPRPKKQLEPISIIPGDEACGEIWDAYVREEWALMTRSYAEDFDRRSKSAQRSFNLLVRKGSKSCMKFNRTFEQFKKDWENGKVQPLPSPSKRKPSTDYTIAEEDEMDEEGPELSMIDDTDSPLRERSLGKMKSKGTAQESPLRAQSSRGSTSKDTARGSALRERSLGKTKSKEAAHGSSLREQSLGKSNSMEIVQAAPSTESKEIAVASSSRPSMTVSTESAPVFNPYASLHIEEHILTHPALLEIVNAAAQAFAADESRLTKPIPNPEQFASFLDQYQRNVVTPAKMQIPDTASQLPDNDAETMDFESADPKVDAERERVMSNGEGHAQHAVAQPLTPSPEPESRTQESRGWFTVASNIITTPFKFIGRGGQSAGKTPATQPLPVAGALQDDQTLRELATPSPTSGLLRRGRAPITSRSRAALQKPVPVSRNNPFQPSIASQNEKKPPIHLRGVMKPEEIAAIHKMEDDLHAEERRKKREAQVEANEAEWEEEYIDEKGHLNIGTWEMVDGKRKITKKRLKNVSFEVPDDSSSDDDSTEGDDEMMDYNSSPMNGKEQEPPKERIFSVTRRALGIPSPPSAVEVQDTQYDPVVGDPHRARPYTGTLLKSSNYVERNVQAGRHPLFSGSLSSSDNSSFTEHHSNSGNEETLQENKWTQSPPPKPKPSNATLPKNSVSEDEAAKAKKARELAEKYKPQKPSRLCEVQQASPVHQKENIENVDPELMAIIKVSVDWDGDQLVNEILGGISDDQIIDTLIIDDETLGAYGRGGSIDRAVGSTFY